MLGGGHCRAMEGAAPETPFDENPPVLVKLKRRRRKKRDGPERSSARKKGEEPSILERITMPAAVKKLSLGGRSGRHREESSKWCFRAATEPENNDNKLDKKEETYRLIDISQIEESMNSLTTCKCKNEKEVKDFIHFCSENESGYCEEKLLGLWNRWKEGCESNSSIKKDRKLKMHDKQIGCCTKTYLTCEDCGTQKEMKGKEARKFKGKEYNRNHNERENCAWYETNLKVVLGAIASGICPSDVETLFKFLDIPIPSSFPYVTFPKLENLIGEAIMKVSEQSMRDGLKKEIELESGKKYSVWIQLCEKIGIIGSYDMGWNKRSSGNRYDSLTGHAFLIGCKSKSILSAQVTSKKCTKCSKSSAKNVTAPPHKCPLNYDGSSKGMEVEAALDIVTRIGKEHNGRVFVKAIVSDDDSSMRALLKHKQNSKKGRLPSYLPEPKWLADPGHRTKSVSSKIYNLLKLKKSQSTCTKADAIRFKMNFGYMLNRNRGKTLQQISKASRAVIDHTFDKHDYCSTDWCIPKRDQEKEEKQKDSPINPVSLSNEHLGARPNPPSAPKRRPRYYRSIVKDKALYDQMWEIYSPCILPHRLEESLHTFDTQLNESLNHSISKYAPKYKSLGSTMALTHRVSVAVGIHNLGHLQFWKEVLEELDINMTQSLCNYLSNKDNRKAKRRIHQSTPEVKRKRKRETFEKLQVEMEKLRRDKERGATYETGMTINSSMPPDVERMDREKKETLEIKCKLAGCYKEQTHMRRSSKMCTYYKVPPDRLQSAIDAKLRELYPTFYSEYLVLMLFIFVFRMKSFLYLFYFHSKKMFIVHVLVLFSISTCTI